jgi:threonine aldolase
MRFIAAPWVGLLESGAWLEHARHANQCARRLEAGLREVKGVEIIAPTQANAVFAQLPADVSEGLRRRGWQFYSFIGAGGARFMCSWETAEEDVAALLCDVRELASNARLS